jgi:hypothetical protein
MAPTVCANALVGIIATGNVITKPELTNKVARVLLIFVFTARWVVVTFVMLTPNFSVYFYDV